MTFSNLPVRDYVTCQEGNQSTLVVQRKVTLLTRYLIHICIPGTSKVGFFFDNQPKVDKWAELRTPGRNLMEVVQTCLSSNFDLSAIHIKMCHSLYGPLLEINFWQQVRPPPCLHFRMEILVMICDSASFCFNTF